MLIRIATPADIPEMGRVRMSVRENRIDSLASLRPGDTERMISGDGRGWVAEVEETIVGFAIADLSRANVYALFVEPGYERRGIGRALHDAMMDWFFSTTVSTVWLSTDPGTRAEAFYRQAGWISTGIVEKGEIRFEMACDRWSAIRASEPAVVLLEPYGAVEVPKLDLPSGFYLFGVDYGDEGAFVTHLSDGRIGEMIPALPYPYGPDQAEAWVRHRVAFRTRTGVETTFAVRRPDGYLVGSVGVDDFPVGVQDTAELGYWLAPSERGRGLATTAVRAFVSDAFQSLALSRITARTLVINRSSIGVLERVGFQRLSGSTKTTTRAGTFDTIFFELRRP